MSRRNKTLLIILIILLGVMAFFWLTRNEPAPAPGEEGVTNFWQQFNPFRSDAPTPPAPPGEESPPTSDIPPLTSQFRRVSSMPVAGYAVFQRERYKVVEEGTTTTPSAPEVEIAPALRYVARVTGNIYQTFADTIDERRFTNTLVPRVYEAFFGNKAEAVVMRRLKENGKTIETFVGSLPKEVLGGDASGENEVSGTFREDNIADLAVSLDGTKIFYLLGSGENTVGITDNILGGKRVQVFDSPFNEWLSGWPSLKLITLATKPSGLVPGHLYALNPDTKSLQNILSGISGLTALGSPDGKLILYADGNLSLSIYAPEGRTTVSTGVRTLPEKCVWAKASALIYCSVPGFVPSGIYPDDWYQGEVSFADAIWRIDAETGTGTVVFNPAETLDGIKLILDESENYLFLVDKSTSILWELEL